MPLVKGNKYGESMNLSFTPVEAPLGSDNSFGFWVLGPLGKTCP